MRTGPTRSTSPACFLARLRRDFRAVYLAGLLCCAMLLPACLLVWLGVYLRVFWLSLAGGAAGGLLGAQGVCGLFDTLLRSRRAEELAAVRGCSEGIENRLRAAIRTADSAETLYGQMKTKRYPHARLRRLALDAALGVRAGALPPLPPLVQNKLTCELF